MLSECRRRTNTWWPIKEIKDWCSTECRQWCTQVTRVKQWLGTTYTNKLICNRWCNKEWLSNNSKWGCNIRPMWARWEWWVATNPRPCSPSRLTAPWPWATSNLTRPWWLISPWTRWWEWASSPRWCRCNRWGSTRLRCSQDSQAVSRWCSRINKLWCSNNSRCNSNKCSNNSCYVNSNSSSWCTSNNSTISRRNE